MTTGRLFWTVVAIQAVVLVGMVALKERTLAQGTMIAIKTRPVDPTDLARGSYVDLSYDIEDVERAGVDVDTGDEVVVALRPDGRVWVADGARDNANEAGAMFIRGTVVSRSGDRLEVDYDIGTYYASAERAQRAEAGAAGGAIAQVSLDELGRTTLCGLEGYARSEFADSCGAF